MRYRSFGKTSFKVSCVGMGTYYDPLWIALAALFGIRRGANTKLEALRAGLGEGINFIDTAELYRSEPIVGEAIREKKRDELFVASKVWPNHLRPDAVVKSCKKSLSRLETPYLDLYQIHFPNRSVSIRGTMSAMEKLVDDGLIRAIGVSNFSYNEMLEAEEALKRHELSSTQMNYNLAERDIERSILPHCEKESIALIAYFPLAHGKLAKTTGRSGALSEIAAKHSTQGKSWTTSQVALGWLLKRSGLIFPIPRASKENHVRENAAASELELTGEDMERIEQAYPFRA